MALAGDVLASCSNDQTLRVWQPYSPGALLAHAARCCPAAQLRHVNLCAAPLPPPPCLPPADAALGCLRGHTDYVTCLAAAPGGAWLASGGLRGEVLLWDLAALRAVIAGGVPVRSQRTSLLPLPLAGPAVPVHDSLCCHPPPRPCPALQGQSYGASAAEVPRHSVYALAMSGDASLVAAGSTQVAAAGERPRPRAGGSAMRRRPALPAPLPPPCAPHRTLVRRVLSAWSTCETGRA